MRPIHGSMMDPIAATAKGGVSETPVHFITATPADAADTVEGRQAPRLPLPLAALARVAKLQQVGALLLQRQGQQAAQATPAVPLVAFDPAAAAQGLQLAAAAADQWGSLLRLWFEGLDELGSEMGELRQANTLSKYVDQEMNLVQQTLALFSNQATATVRLAENIQINLAFWLAQRAAA